MGGSGENASVPAGARLWLDVETKLPVRFETDISGPEILTIVYHEIRWNVELDPDLFIPKIPEDYQEEKP